MESFCERGASVAVIGSLIALVLAGCSVAPQPSVSEENEAAIEELPEFSIEDVDFATAEWSLSHYGQMIPTDGVVLTDGKAEIETVVYTIDADGAVYSDADGDGDLDAIVPVDAVSSDGTDLNRAWYLWADHEGEAVQVRVPAALSGNCDTVVDSVTAASGGFEIREFHLRSGEETYLVCGDPGSDERIRTVGIADDGPDGELWPLQTAPFVSFGGACPISVAFHGDPAQTEHFPAPNPDSTPLAGEQINTWPVEDWQIFRDGYPGWGLVGVNVDGNSGCAWKQL